MEATLLSTLMLLVEELPVKTGEHLHGFALPLADPFYGTFDKIFAALRKRLRPDPRAYFAPNCLMTCSLPGLNTPKSQHHFVCIRREGSVAIYRDLFGWG
jgi:hypothetical protein